LDRQIPAHTSLLFYLILALVLIGIVWAYFMPVETIIPGRGYVSFLGEPQAVCAPEMAVVKALTFRGVEEVTKGQKILTIERGSTHGVWSNGTEILAPEAGVLLWQRELMKGDMLQTGERLAVIYPLEPIGIKVFLQEQDFGRIKPGLPVRIKLDAYPQQNFGIIEGVVEELILENNPIPGREMQVAVLITLDNTPNSEILLRPGLQASVEIITGQTSLLKKLLF